MVAKEKFKVLKQLLQQTIDEADERDVAWLMKWHKVKKQSALFGLNEKRLNKAVHDLRGLMIGRHIREDS